MKKLFIAIAITLTFAVMFANGLFAQIPTPQGRLTLQSGTPVLHQDVVDATTLYYTPYVGNNLPVSNGTSLSNQTFSELSMSLSALPDGLYDIYAIYVSGAFQLCDVAAWSGYSRTSGFGLTQLQGIWVNASTLEACDNSTSGYTVPAKEGIYLGTVYSSPHPGYDTVGMTMQFAPAPSPGGTQNGGNLLGVYNAYNRVRIISKDIDNTANWTYSEPGWRMTDGGSTNHGNLIYFVDGLQQSFVDAQIQLVINTSASTVAGVIGVEIDSTTGSPTGATGLSFNTSQSSIAAFDHYLPVLGFHYVAGVEYASGATVYFATDSGTTEDLKVELEM